MPIHVDVAPQSALARAAKPGFRQRDGTHDATQSIREAANGFTPRREARAPAVIDELAADEIQPSLALIQELPEPARTRFLLALVSRWSRFEPEDAAEFAIETFSDSHISEALNAIGATWGDRQPEAAIDWAQSLATDEAHRFRHVSRTAGALQRVLSAWARRDLTAAMALASELHTAGIDSAYRGIVALVAIDDHRDAVLDAILAIENDAARTETVDNALTIWAKPDPRGAAAWIDAHAVDRPAVVQHVARSLLSVDPIAGADWLLSRARTPDERQQAIDTVSRRWDPNRFEEAAAWLERVGGESR